MVWQRKVIWSEGMFLRPQHFQQQDRYFNAMLQARSLPAQAFFWGFSELSLDTGLLALGKLGVRSAKGVLPDGTPFCLPEDDEPPQPLEISKEQASGLVHLALPLRRPTGAEVSLQASGTPSARYQSHVLEVSDCNDIGAQPSLMQLGQMRLSLRLAADVTEGWVTLPVAQLLERHTNGSLVLDTAYIPPTVNNAQHTPLSDICKELHGLLRQRGTAFEQRMLQAGRGGIGEVSDFLLLQFVNHWEAAAAHWVAVGTIHPERLFDQMVRMAGELATFTPQRRCGELPTYDHLDLRGSFAPLMQKIRECLGSEVRKASQIDLQEREAGTRFAMIQPKEWLSSCRFVLAVFAQTPVDRLHEHAPNQIKLGPSEHIRNLVGLNLPALPMHVLPVAPQELPFHAGFSYFELDTKHELWQQLQDSAGLALHANEQLLPGLQLELWAIRRS